MKLEDYPDKIVTPFASQAGTDYIQDIPEISQIGITAGRASWDDGFPPLTMTDKAAGGRPPSGRDFNGVLKAISSVARSVCAGALSVFDNDFASSPRTGGYPKGAQVLRSDGTGTWINTVDDNSDDPEDYSNSGWLPAIQTGVTSISVTDSNVTLTPVQYGNRIIKISGTQTADLNLIFPDNIPGKWTIIRNNTFVSGYIFDLNVKTSSGSVLTALGDITYVISDGDEIYTTGNDSIVSVDSISDLRLLTPKKKNVRTLGYYSPGDGGGAIFYPVVTGSHTDNGGTIITAGGGTTTGAWIFDPSQFITVKHFGAVGDGSTDDTSAIQAAINASSGKELRINQGTYIVDPLTAVSNLTITFDPDATLKAKTGYAASDRLLNIYNVSDVTIHGNHANIVMIKSEYTEFEQRHGVIIQSSSNVTINDLHVSDTGGDGFYIGRLDGQSTSTNIYLNNCFSDNALRNGLSIISGNNVYINGGEYSNTTGTSPQFGIDIEPNSSSDSMKNINIIGVKTSNNDSGGIQIVLSSLGATTKNDVSINIDKCYSYMDGGNGGVRFANSPDFKLSGSVNVTNQTIENPYAFGMQFIRLNALMPFINIKNLTVINPAFSKPSPGNIDKSCIDLNAQSSSNTGTVENVTFDNIKCIDSRDTPIMFSCIYAGGTYGVNNISIRNLSPNPVPPSNLPNFPGKSIIYAGNCNNISVSTNESFTSTFDHPVTGINSTVEVYSVGQVLSSAGSTLTLGLASTCYGVEVNFAFATTAAIAPSTGDYIYFQGLAVSTGFYLEDRDSITLKAVTGGWKVVKSNFPLKTGSGSPITNSITTRFIGRQYFDTTGKNHWVSTGTTTADWKQVSN